MKTSSKAFSALAAGLLALTLIPTGSAEALRVGNTLGCPGDRYVSATGSARGYVMVAAGSAVSIGGSDHTGTTTYTRTANATTGGSNTWSVSSGEGDTEVPSASATCKIR